jgi:hypothetical protein
MKHKSKTLPKRNPLAIPVIVKTGAGKHKDKKKESKDYPIEDSHKNNK